MDFSRGGGTRILVLYTRKMQKKKGWFFFLAGDRYMPVFMKKGPS